MTSTATDKMVQIITRSNEDGDAMIYVVTVWTGRRYRHVADFNAGLVGDEQARAWAVQVAKKVGAKYGIEVKV